MKQTGLWIICWLCLVSTLYGATEPVELSSLKQEQQDALALIQQSNLEEWGQLETLKALNKNLWHKTREVHRMDRKVNHLKKRVRRLKNDSARRTKKITERTEQLNQKFQALFYLNKISQLTLFPGQGNLTSYFRNKRQLQKLSTADAEEVLQLKIDLDEQQKELSLLKSQSTELLDLQETAQAQQVSLQVEQKQIRIYLKQLHKDQTQHKKYLKEIKQRLTRLNQVARSRPPIAAQSPQTNQLGPDQDLAGVKRFSGFSKLKHQLNPPVEGKLVLDFGGSERLYKKGLLIQTKPEAKAKAIWVGTVVFAGDFKGFGKLVMVDHGRGSLSIYGNLETVLVKKGQLVERGDPVGQVGQVLFPRSGTLLYFETRYHKRAVNPKRWLKPSRWDE